MKPFWKTLCLISLLLTYPPLTFADTAYRWEDRAGNVHFGSNPPRGALNVSKVSDSSFSRYSTSRVLSRMRRPDETPPVEVSSNTDGDSFAIDPAPLSPARLEQRKLSVAHNENQHVTACKVEVRNSGGETAKDVLISFEFEDGTIIPGSGPESIAGSKLATYFIRPEHLPVIVPEKDSSVEDYKGTQSKRKAPKPNVILQFGAPS